MLLSCLSVTKMKHAKSFLTSYADLPSSLRREPIVVIDDEPYSWNAVKIEVENATKLGGRMLEKLVNMGIVNAKQ